jgi:hypothetical protein
MLLTKARSMWIVGAEPAETHPLSGQGKVLQVASPSSVGLVEGVFIASSVAIKSARVRSHSNAFLVVTRSIVRGFVVLGLRPLIVPLLPLALRLLTLLASGAPRPHSLVVPHRPSSSQSWAEVMSHSSLRAVTPPSSSPRCCEEFNLNASLDSLF